MHGRIIICNFPVFRPLISWHLSSFECGFLMRYSYYLRYAYLIVQSIPTLFADKAVTLQDFYIFCLIKKEGEKSVPFYGFSRLKTETPTQPILSTYTVKCTLCVLWYVLCMGRKRRKKTAQGSVQQYLEGNLFSNKSSDLSFRKDFFWKSYTTFNPK